MSDEIVRRTLCPCSPSRPVHHQPMPLVCYLSTSGALMEHRGPVEVGEAEALCANPSQANTRQLIAATPELPAGAA